MQNFKTNLSGAICGKKSTRDVKSSEFAIRKFFVDEQSFLRVRSEVKKAELSFDQKIRFCCHPITN